jgi:glycerol-3-phosphate cytidylyltransferase
MIGGKTVAFTSGTFDLFHTNHLRMIKYARGLADILIVGVSTDELVCSYKKPPAIPFEERIAIVESLKYPDVVIPQHSLDHTEKVQELHFDIFVVGNDWKGKYDYLNDLGVTTVYFPYGTGSSSTAIKETIYEAYRTQVSEVDQHDRPEIK